MSKVVTDNQYYTAIANAIRALTGSSNTYTPAQMAPAIMGYIAGGIDLSNIESYFINETVNAMKYVKELGTSEWVHHIVITDTHFTKNFGHSTAIVKAMQDTGYFSKVIHLGDISDDATEASYTASAENYGQFNGDLLFAIGNHDAMGSYGWETYYYNNLLDEDSDLVIDSSSNYNYYWDDAEHHIRYIVYIYSNAMGGDTYAINRIKDAPSGYSVITLCHYKDVIASKILLPLIAHEVDYIGNIAGHEHVDGYGNAYNGMYNQVFLNNDGWINDNPSYVKTAETNTSQALTIMSINTSTKNVKFYRIGMPTTLGKNWQYTYVAGGTDGWIEGYYWGSGEPKTNADSYISTKKYPAKDSLGNPIRYYIYSQTGAVIYVYALGMDSSSEWVTNQRRSAATDSLFNNIGILDNNRFAESVESFLIGVDTDGNVQNSNDIIVTSVKPTLGKTLDTVEWTTGYYLNVNATPVADSGSVYTAPFDVLPNTTYRFYVDDANWSGTNYLYAFTYDGSPLGGNSVGWKLTRRVGANATGSKEFTFTTSADESVIRISSQGGLADVANYASKCHLEVVS